MAYAGTDIIRNSSPIQQENTKHYIEILENCYDGAWFWENLGDSERFHATPRMKKRLGYSENAAIGDTRHWWFENIHPDDMPVLLAEREKYIINKEVNHCELYIRIRARSGEYITFFLQIHVIKDEQGHLVNGGGVFLDVSKHQKGHSSSTYNSDENTEREIRTCLSSILGSIEILKSGSLEETQRHCLDNMQESAEMIALTLKATPQTISNKNFSSDGDNKDHGHNVLNILLVEDNKINQEVLVGLITKIGDKIEVANHGLEALQMFDKNDYDIILMDINMPIMDGLTATRKIRETEKGRSIPIIAVTANTVISDRNNCIAHGMNDVVTKPVTKALLENMLNSYRNTLEIKTSVSPEVISEATVGFQYITLEAVEGLKEDLGYETLERLFTIYKRDAAVLIENLQTTNEQERHNTAHTLAGMSENLGIFGIGKISRSLMDLKESQGEEGNSLVKELTEKFQLALDEIDRYFEKSK